MIGVNFTNCKDCAQRREMMQRWAAGWAEWAKNPLGPRPGTKEWLERNQHVQHDERRSDDPGESGDF